MPRFVLDCSMTLAWAFEDEGTPYTEHVRDLLQTGSMALVPSLWTLEVGNGLRSAERRGRIDWPDMQRFVELLEGFAIRVYPVDDALGRVLRLAREQQLTTYDASYLDLAMREDVALATLDGPLRTAADRVGVPLVTETV